MCQLLNPVKSQKLNCEGVFNHNAFVLRPKAQWPTGWLWLTYYYFWSTLFVVHLQSAVLKCDNLSYRNFLNMIYTLSSLDIECPILNCALFLLFEICCHWYIVSKWAFSHFMNRRKSKFCQRVNTSPKSCRKQKLYRGVTWFYNWVWMFNFCFVFLRHVLLILHATHFLIMIPLTVLKSGLWSGQ